MLSLYCINFINNEFSRKNRLDYLPIIYHFVKIQKKNSHKKNDELTDRKMDQHRDRQTTVILQDPTYIDGDLN